MLDYTKAAIKKTIDEFKRVDYIRNVATQVLYIAYLTYALIAGAGVRIACAILLGITLCYFVFFFIVTTGRVGRLRKKAKKVVTKVFTRCKQLIKLFTLGVMIYGIYATTKLVTPLSVILSAFMIVGWILQIVFEVIFKFFLNRAQFILEGMEADYENFVKPAKTVGNFFKKLTGKEVEPEKEKSKSRVWLDKKVAENKAKKEEQKRENKQRKKQDRADEKQAKKRARADAKDTVFLPEPTKPAETLPAPEPTEVYEDPKLLE